MTGIDIEKFSKMKKERKLRKNKAYKRIEKNERRKQRRKKRNFYKSMQTIRKVFEENLKDMKLRKLTVNFSLNDFKDGPLGNNIKTSSNKYLNSVKHYDSGFENMKEDLNKISKKPEIEKKRKRIVFDLVEDKKFETRGKYRKFNNFYKK